MKKHVTILLCAVLFVAGLGILLYPTVSNWLAERNASYAVEQYIEQTTSLDELYMQQELARARTYNSTLVSYELRDPFNPDEEFEIPADYMEILNVDGMIGYLEIPKISLSLAIKHGVSEDVLQRNVGHMQATAFPIGGESTHSVLTGHRGLPSAKLFTDLDQMTEGDLFFIHVLGEVFAYEVDQVLVVEPHETEALMPVAGKDYVTLITCTPYGINSHRMFVRGRRVPYTQEVYEEALAAAGTDWWWYLLVGGSVGLVLATLFVVLAISRAGRKKRRRTRR